MYTNNTAQPTGERALQEAATLAKRLQALGYEVGPILYEIEQRRQACQLVLTTRLLDDYQLVPPAETTDEYFTSFAPDGSAPNWQPRLLAVGRAFTFSKAQQKALAALTHFKILPEATVFDLAVEQGHIVGITLSFPQESKLRRFHLSPEDFYTWVRSYKKIALETPALADLATAKPSKTKPKSAAAQHKDTLLALLADL